MSSAVVRRHQRVNLPVFANNFHIVGDLFGYLSPKDRCAAVAVPSIFQDLALVRIWSVTSERLLLWNQCLWETWLKVTLWYQVSTIWQALDTPELVESAQWLQQALQREYASSRAREGEGQGQSKGKGQGKSSGKTCGDTVEPWARYRSGEATAAYERRDQQTRHARGKWSGSSW